MSWSSIRSQLPATGWTIVRPTGEMILDPVPDRECAERMAGQNVGGSLRKALKRGFRIVQVEIRAVEVAS